MNKQEARIKIITEAIQFRNTGFSPEGFKKSLDDDEWTLSNYEIYNSYQMIKNEIDHIIQLVWTRFL